MEKTKIFTIIYLNLILIILLTSISFAETNRNIPPSTRDLQEILAKVNLSKEQKIKIAKILKETKNRLTEIQDQIEKMRKQSLEIIKQYPLNKNAAIENQEQIAELLERIHMIRSKTFFEIIALLDEEQYKTFVELTFPEK
ncbi:MAG: Spy/CpxP family protein refolding chaperone [Brevinematia bacterium]